MSYVAATPEALLAAATNVAGIGSTISEANAAAAVPTTGILAPAADGVSAQVAALFSTHGEVYQRLSTQFATFHDQFAHTLSAGANSYAATEASAAQNLVNALNTPAEKLLGQPLIGQSGLVSNAVGQAQSIFAGSATATAGTSPLALPPTGSAAAAPAAVIPVSVATAMENFYTAVEPWVQYGFTVASWAAGWLPYIGILAPQISFYYFLFEPIVQSALFNSLNWLDGTITFSQGLSNLWSSTTMSINQFINTEINWIRSFLPPPPPFF
ncbi:PE family protein [Mycobacterium simiae]|uniref:PE family protein n=1 Tax=Mycobacterium simiae TaxID=1784 RepID=A0A5B1BPV1_MYCSI|nr:PE family protein [Mycobacterium simiae]KAA1250788.1 PE family protein [Mycobacterium simiae]